MEVGGVVEPRGIGTGGKSHICAMNHPFFRQNQHVLTEFLEGAADLGHVVQSHFCPGIIRQSFIAGDDGAGDDRDDRDDD